MDVRATIDVLYVSYVPVVYKIVHGILIGASIPWVGLIIRFVLLPWSMALLT